LRRLQGSPIPLRMRAASNPGNAGHLWVKRRFLTTQHPDRLFLPAKLADNPFLDREAYTRALSNLPTFQRRQLLEGAWSEFSGGVVGRGEWPGWGEDKDIFVLQPSAAGSRGRPVFKRDCLIFLAVDPATSSSRTADYTAILVFALCPTGELLILDAFRQQID